MTAAKAKRVVHDAVKRAKIILFRFVGDTVEPKPLRRHTYMLRTRLATTPLRPGNHPWLLYRLKR